MEGCSENGEACPQLLDLIPREREWLVKRVDDRSSEEKKLELRLGPPGEEWFLGKNASKNADNRERDESLLSLGTAPGPVVGWPPIRSCRKNLASSSSSKRAIDSQNESPNKKVASEKPVETCQKGMFVKINMDGVPIGRKVDLKACDSYEKLSTAVDELFRGLLAGFHLSYAYNLTSKRFLCWWNHERRERRKVITGVLDGSGEYTLVYEDNEGDRMLVGDVPWHMFVSTVKRLRVLKSSEVSALSLGSSKQKAKYQ
ncbi:hypothetical protein GH714_020339 [Hevea brasiliensis]|uniref:Auxin-responsive protein n=1 Tax=Hevea brasiliensis TaxID=3981 RepID=A0A6A6LLI7_HEVBR|nr:hypothetical protein GH714_020339 [Hevea brasiliensis]